MQSPEQQEQPAASCVLFMLTWKPQSVHRCSQKQLAMVGRPFLSLALDFFNSPKRRQMNMTQ